jgi:hypothetical protein
LACSASDADKADRQSSPDLVKPVMIIFAAFGYMLRKAQRSFSHQGSFQP